MISTQDGAFNRTLLKGTNNIRFASETVLRAFSILTAYDT